MRFRRGAKNCSSSLHVYGLSARARGSIHRTVHDQVGRVPISIKSSIWEVRNMSSTTHIQAKSLLDDLKGVEGNVSWQVGKMVNALREKAVEEQSDNVTLAVLDPLTPGPNNMHISGAGAADVRAILGQIVAATDSGPNIG